MSDREQLRDRLVELFSWMNEQPLDSGTDRRVADEVLAEIESAGYVLMDRGRAERLRQAAAVVLEWYPVLQDAAVTPPKPEYRLRPGDTDPLEGGE